MKVQFTINTKEMHNAMSSNFNGISIEPKFYEADNLFGFEPKYYEDESGKFRVPDYWVVEGDFTANELMHIGRLQEKTNDKK